MTILFNSIPPKARVKIPESNTSLKQLWRFFLKAFYFRTLYIYILSSFISEDWGREGTVNTWVLHVVGCKTWKWICDIHSSANHRNRADLLKAVCPGVDKGWQDKVKAASKPLRLIVFFFKPIIHSKQRRKKKSCNQNYFWVGLRLVKLGSLLGLVKQLSAQKFVIKGADLHYLVFTRVTEILLQQIPDFAVMSGKWLCTFVYHYHKVSWCLTRW